MTILTSKKHDTIFQHVMNQGNGFWQVYDAWEPETFTIFDQYLRPDKNYIDIGAWIGPTVLYAAQKAKTVYAVEPNPASFIALKTNVELNGYNNVVLGNYGLAENGSSRRLAIQGSGSSILIDDKEFIAEHGERPIMRPYTNKTPTIVVETRPVSYLFDQIDLANVSLVKIDTEGSEKYIVPAMTPYLKKLNCPIYISLHWGFLRDRHVEFILDTITSTHPIIEKARGGKTTTKAEIVSSKISHLLLKRTAL